MTNHARTLLLNRPAGTGDIFVPSVYGPVAVPGHLKAIRVAALSGATNDEFLVAAVASWLTLLHNPDIEKYALSLDSRVTYDPITRKTVSDGAPFNLALAVSKVVTAAQQQSGVGAYSLFRPVAGYEQELSELKKLWDVKTRAEDKAAAALYGYIYQLERIRIND